MNVLVIANGDPVTTTAAAWDGTASTALSVTTDGDAGTFSASGANSFVANAATATTTGIATAAAAATATTDVTTAITSLATDRATIGANLSVLHSYQEQIVGLKDTLSGANSRIKDVDVAGESTQFARFNILVQAGTAMLAQANSGPQSVLRLLQ